MEPARITAFDQSSEYDTQTHQLQSLHQIVKQTQAVFHSSGKLNFMY